MTDEIVPADIRKFIRAHISTIGHLEALLILRADPIRLWNAEDMARRLYVSERETQEMLARLCADGLIVRDNDAYRYAPEADKAATIDRLADVYARHLIPVTNIIHQEPSRIREFADAFKLKKEP